MRNQGSETEIKRPCIKRKDAKPLRSDKELKGHDLHRCWTSFSELRAFASLRLSSIYGAAQRKKIMNTPTMAPDNALQARKPMVSTRSHLQNSQFERGNNFV